MYVNFNIYKSSDITNIKILLVTSLCLEHRDVFILSTSEEQYFIRSTYFDKTSIAVLIECIELHI
jgi:DNA phosphorothioation-dependent restriction protein DptG